MERINVHLSEKQLERLNDLVNETGLKRAELIRRAVDEFLGQDHNLIAEMSVALETCDSMNRAGGRWAADSPFQEKIDELLVRSGWRRGVE